MPIIPEKYYQRLTKRFFFFFYGLYIKKKKIYLLKNKNNNVLRLSGIDELKKYQNPLINYDVAFPTVLIEKDDFSEK